MLQDLYNRLLGNKRIAPVDPLEMRRRYGGSGDIGETSIVRHATQNGAPGLVNIDLRSRKNIPSSFYRPGPLEMRRLYRELGQHGGSADLETDNVPTYDPRTRKYVYDQPRLTPPTPGDVVPVVTGLTPGGEIDRTQSDEYKSIRAQYDALRKRGESAMTPEGMREKALDYGLTEWAKLHPTLAARQQAGSFNPLMQSTFGYQTGEAPDQVQRSMVIGGQRYDVDPEAIQYQIDQQQTQDMNAGNPLEQSAEQQLYTAKQAGKGLEEKESVLKRTDAFLNPYYTRMY